MWAQGIGIAVLGCLLALLLKNRAPELGFVLSCVLIGAALLVCLSLFRPVLEVFGELTRMSGLTAEVTAPLMKCVGIAAATKIAADLCRDAKETAVAAAVELCGTLAGLTAALPLLLSAIRMIRGIL
jgi:stage III sporulation protein AD